MTPSFGAGHFIDEFAPCGFRRGLLPAILSPGFQDMAGPAQCLQVVERPRIAALVERHPVIAFEPSGTAAPDAAPAVALEDGAAGSPPTSRIKVGVVAAQDDARQTTKATSQQLDTSPAIANKYPIFSLKNIQVALCRFCATMP